MTTNNHPAHGPVSLDRLHQIREILSKAAAQSDGGNLGYAMADAVKVIDGVIAAFGAEPVAWKAGNRAFVTRVVAEMYACEIMTEVQPLYTSQPSAVSVPDEVNLAIENLKQKLVDCNRYNYCSDAVKSVEDACRAAMLQAGNSPATPDTWIPVSERMPDEDGNYWGWWSESKRQGPVWFIKSELQAQFQSSEITHWMPLPAAPRSEVKRG
ncbi:DUF551 domain-containing protein [Citrobacter freundii]|nr:DUF551 domain-containing protein [Citrobacter freundii]MEB2764179.1 DUF551 domain-containing protein [Citrobacter freundii]